LLITVSKGFDMEITAKSMNASMYTQNTTQTSKETQSAKVSYDEVTIKNGSSEMSVKVFDYQAAAMQEFFGKSQDGSNKEFSFNSPEFNSFLDDIGYEGKPINELSQEEAAELVSEDGFFGIEQTAQRIADFVISGAGDNEDLLRAGREGVLKGFDEAEEIWGGKLPDISYKTIEKAVEMIDTKMHELGFNIIDEDV
jgi:hypothetical protein